MTDTDTTAATTNTTSLVVAAVIVSVGLMVGGLVSVFGDSGVGLSIIGLSTVFVGQTIIAGHVIQVGRSVRGVHDCIDRRADAIDAQLTQAEMQRLNMADKLDDLNRRPPAS